MEKQYKNIPGQIKTNTEANEIMNRWKEYFGEPFNSEDGTNCFMGAEEKQQNGIKDEEVKKTIANIKREMGQDQIASEIMNNMEPGGRKVLTKMFNTAWNKDATEEGGYKWDTGGMGTLKFSFFPATLGLRVLVIDVTSSDGAL